MNRISMDSSMVVDGTQIERHPLHGTEVWVKREDLCAPYPGPSFSKIRGLAAHLKSRPESVIGVLDTYHSKAGHATAYVCKELGKTCVDFWPVFKGDRWNQFGSPPFHGNSTPNPYPRKQQQVAEELGAKMVGLQAGRSAILYHQAKKLLQGAYPGAYMLPNALKLPEAIEENAAEVVRSALMLPSSGSLVISVSSGTVAAGVLKGFQQCGLLSSYQVVLHMGYSRSPDQLRSYVGEMAGLTPVEVSRVKVVNEGYTYKSEAPRGDYCPFPCNSHYDLKAWAWLQNRDNFFSLPGPVVFWNIGD